MAVWQQSAAQISREQQGAEASPQCTWITDGTDFSPQPRELTIFHHWVLTIEDFSFLFLFFLFDCDTHSRKR